MVNFNELLEKNMDDIERPKPVPGGTYRLAIKSRPEEVESSQKKTPGLRFAFSIVHAHADVDVDALAEIDLPNKTLRDNFWITPDSIFMVTEFLAKLGIDIEGRSIKEALPEVVGLEIDAEVALTPGRDEGVMYNTITSYHSIEEEAV